MKGIENAKQLKRMPVGAGLEGNLVIQPTLIFSIKSKSAPNSLASLIGWRGMQRMRLNHKLNLK